MDTDPRSLHQMGLEIRRFSADTGSDGLRVIRQYLAGWPYSRPLDEALLAQWEEQGTDFQPSHIWVGYRDGQPRVFLHGQHDGEKFFVHLLAHLPAAVGEAVCALRRIEQVAREARARRLHGPGYAARRFYGGYVLGLEPFHPHWAVETTEAFIRAGFRPGHAAVLMGRELTGVVVCDEPPAGYDLGEVEAEREFQARAFQFVARRGGRTVATASARLYPHLDGPRGGPVGQVGQVMTEPPHRGRGLARILVQMCLRRLQDWGAVEALIVTGLDNLPALRAYERAGFERRHFLTEWVKDLAPTDGGRAGQQPSASLLSLP